jgi:peptide/nickel transport system substrate-binding protein
MQEGVRLPRIAPPDDWPAHGRRAWETCMRLSIRHRALGLAAVATLVAAACGGGGGGTSSTTSTTAASKGGTLSIGSWQEQTSTLACQTLDTMSHACAQEAPMFDGLLDLKSVDETTSAKTIADYYKPALASEVPTVTNGDVKTSGCPHGGAMCVTWKLRSDVTWQDGSTFSSHDVCANFQFMWLKFKDKNPTAVLSTDGWNQVTNCDESPNKAVITFKTVYAPYLTLGTITGQLLPAKELDQVLNAGTDLTKTPVTVDLTLGSKNPDAFKGTATLDKIFIGAGPYVFQSYTPTQSMVMVRNNNYWHHSGPYLDKLIFKFPADVSSMLNSVKAGELDMGLDYRLGFINDLNTEAKNGKIKVQLTPDSGAEHIDLNMCLTAKGLCGTGGKTNPYLEDKTIRKAILTGINRQQIVTTLAAGQAAIPDDSWLYLGNEYARGKSGQTKYDVTAANKLLDDAGYKKDPKCDGGATRAFKDGTCINLDLGTTAGNKVRENAEPLVQADLAAIGIHVNTPYKNAKAGKVFGSFSDGGLIYTHQFDMIMYTNSDSAPAEADGYYAEYHADCGGSCPEHNQIPSTANHGQGQNGTGYDSPQVDSLFDQARATVDLSKRATAYKQISDLLAADLPDIPLYQQQTVNTYTTKLQGFKRNDIIWTFGSEDWYCTGGVCQ